MVQWLNARDKARQYHLPFHLVERFGVRHYRHLIAVSAGVAQQLGELNPRASISVIGNGVDSRAFTVAAGRNQDVVFVGRLEIAQKGLDLLLDAWARACGSVDGQLVIAGTGPDEIRLRSIVAERQLADRVRFVGWVSGQDKYDLFASARLVVVPSRFETFGIVALEALASGTPVLAFDIPCLREVVPTDCGRLVRPFDVAAYAAALADIHQDQQWLSRAGTRGRAAARAYDWNELAREQETIYQNIVTLEPSKQTTTATPPVIPTVHADPSAAGAHS
jgi:glycosyltransferase involved in cell wall biosynthesis